MNNIAFEMWIIFCHRDLHGSFIRCIKIVHKLPIVLCFQDDKKILLVTIIRQLNLVGTLYCNNIFLCQSQLENIIKFYIQSTLFTFYHTKFVLYNLLHFNETLFSGMFPGIKLERSHICGEPIKQILTHIWIKIHLILNIETSQY